MAYILYFLAGVGVGTVASMLVIHRHEATYKRVMDEITKLKGGIG